MNINDFFKENSRVAVAFSGGVDSSVLLLYAKKYAKSVKAYFVKTEFQPQFELDDAVKICKQLDAELEIINISVLDNQRISSNTADRCYHCKKLIMTQITDRARVDGYQTVIDGTNASDDINDRAGYRALCELGVLSPLKICSLTKADIRKTAKENGLFVCTKPSYSCLATRIEAGTQITDDILEITEKAEKVLFDSGFSDFRVRYKNGFALLEMTESDAVGLLKNRSIINTLKGFYKGVSLNLDFRAPEG
ncbi:MAG: ATP-dependent sacrificial sulfur transferase LarE [Eubacterium sp.]